MALNVWIEWLAAALLLAGAFFLLVGAVGLWRLPDPYMRLHAPTKASTLGVGGVLLASMLLGWLQGRPGMAELLITLFVFVTAPVSAMAMAQAALHLRLPGRARLPHDLQRAREAEDDSGPRPPRTGDTP
jgi:multicomponent K+:H+ antiporter subunit G